MFMMLLCSCVFRGQRLTTIMIMISIYACVYIYIYIYTYDRDNNNNDTTTNNKDNHDNNSILCYAVCFFLPNDGRGTLEEAAG